MLEKFVDDRIAESTITVFQLTVLTNLFLKVQNEALCRSLPMGIDSSAHKVLQNRTSVGPSERGTKVVFLEFCIDLLSIGVGLMLTNDSTTNFCLDVLVQNRVEKVLADLELCSVGRIAWLVGRIDDISKVVCFSSSNKRTMPIVEKQIRLERRVSRSI